ncbi:MAG: hypothetical protein HRT89_21880, partial [Lentisphaeria bacterium]|nr:hypothetical protein [Lentisphaeria bacterium]
MIRDPVLTNDFTYDVAWSQDYVIWSSHGFKDSKGDLMGMLRLDRKATVGDSFDLTVKRVVLDGPTDFHQTIATISCQGDELATPRSWQLSNHSLDQDLKALSALSLNESGNFEKGTLICQRDGHESRQEIPGKLAFDWGMLAAVQGLPFEKNNAINFTYLEALSHIKDDQQIYYHGATTLPIGTGSMTVHCFRHLGRGIMPTEYWLDEQHRLLAAIDGGHAYILKDLMDMPQLSGMEAVLDRQVDEP